MGQESRRRRDTAGQGPALPAARSRRRPLAPVTAYSAGSAAEQHVPQRLTDSAWALTWSNYGQRPVRPNTCPLESGEFEGVSHVLDGVPAVGDLVLFLAGHLRVGAATGVAVGDENGVIAEPGGTARLGGERTVHGSLEDAKPVGGGVPECSGDGGAAIDESCGHCEDALGANTVEEPGDEGAGEAVPRVN